MCAALPTPGVWPTPQLCPATLALQELGLLMLKCGYCSCLTGLARIPAVGGELPAPSSETEQLLTLLQELEEEVFAATASAEKGEVRCANLAAGRAHYLSSIA